MHSTKFEVDGREYTTIHHSDYEGDVIIVPADSKIQWENAKGEKRAVLGNVIIPFDLMKAIVFDYLRGKAASFIKDCSDDEIERMVTRETPFLTVNGSPRGTR